MHLTMKNSLAVILCSALLVGCRYQYFTMTSDLPEKEGGGFVFENDSLRIDFNFISKSSLQLNTVNKTEKIMYLDLAKSAIILNGFSNSFSSGGIPFHGTVSSNSNAFSGLLSSAPERLFIPPKSQVRNVVMLNHLNFEQDLVTSRNFQKINHGTSTVAKQFSFSDQDSIGYFKTFLFLADKEELNPLVLENNFWIKQIVMSGVEGTYTNNSQFVDSKMSGFGQFVAGTAILGGAILVAIYAPDEETE